MNSQSVFLKKSPIRISQNDANLQEKRLITSERANSNYQLSDRLVSDTISEVDEEYKLEHSHSPSNYPLQNIRDTGSQYNTSAFNYTTPSGSNKGSVAEKTLPRKNQQYQSSQIMLANDFGDHLFNQKKSGDLINALFSQNLIAIQSNNRLDNNASNSPLIS